MSYYSSEKEGNHLYLYMDFMAGVSQLKLLFLNVYFLVRSFVCLFL